MSENQIYAYLFPGIEPLKIPENLFDEFNYLEIEYAETYIKKFVENGYYCSDGEQKFSEKQLKSILKNREMFYLKTYIKNRYCHFRFMNDLPIPHISISTSTSIYELSDSEQKIFCNAVQKFAKLVNASYVTIRYFNKIEEDVEIINGRLDIDPKCLLNYFSEINKIWIDKNKKVEFPVGIPKTKGHEIDNGFIEYEIKPFITHDENFEEIINIPYEIIVDNKCKKKLLSIINQFLIYQLDWDEFTTKFRTYYLSVQRLLLPKDKEFFEQIKQASFINKSVEDLMDNIDYLYNQYLDDIK